MTDYSKGKIYKLETEDGSLVYYGSTIKTLNQRLCRHCYNYCRYLDDKYGYNTSFEIVKTKNHKISLVEEYHCNSKEELETRERFWIENNPCVNKVIPTQTKKEYCDKNKDNKLFYNKQYYDKNKDNVLKQQKEYYDKNKEKINKLRSVKITCECGSVVSRNNIALHLKTIKHQSYIKSNNNV